MSLSIYEQILNNMLNIIGKSKEDIVNDPDFYFNNKLTKEQYERWYNNSLNLLYENLPNSSQVDIKKALDLFDIKWGLLYINERPQAAWSEEAEEAFKDIKQKRLGVDNTLKNLTK